MKLKLHKMQGCGNDFLLIDAMGDTPPDFYRSEVQWLCNRHFGIGADGLVILRHTNAKADAAWTFYNCDGSEAQMCGNAARCAIRYLAETRFQQDDVIALETKAGIIRGKKLAGDDVEITLFSKGDVRLDYQERVLSSGDDMFSVFCINTGVPHAVIEVKDILTYPIDDIGRRLLHHPAFGPEGSNITFYQRLVSNRIRSTTFERGVEKETLACGTGAAAAAIIYAEQYLQSLPIEVVVPGGELTVDISAVSKVLLLRGQAKRVFEVELDDLPNQFEPPELYGRKKGARA